MNRKNETIEAQSDFLHCYRGRMGLLYHLSYLRQCKSKLIYHTLKKCDFNLSGAKVFDYAFGSGTFLRGLPSSCSVYGVELDPSTVAEVEVALKRKAFKTLELSAIDVECWQEHKLLNNTYDLIVCSHILEHLDDPVEFIARLKKCLTPDGVLICLVPINETVNDPHHVQECSRPIIADWAEKSGLRITYYVETDHWNYWAKKYLYSDKRRVFRKAWSMVMGSISVVFPNAVWWALSKVCGKLTASKATQAGFVLKK